MLNIILCLGTKLYSQLYDKNYIVSVVDYNSTERAVKIEYNKELDSIIFTDINLGMSLLGYNIHMNDASGKLIFYTNGLQIFNQYHHLMENGDSLNYYGEFSDSFIYESAKRNGHYFGGDGIMNPLPIPGQENEYLFFHSTAFIGDFDRGYSALRYSRIDMSLNDSIGAVIEKNILIEPNVYLPQFTKHANGQDWWILCVNQENVDSINYYVYLLDENGISGPSIYEGGSPHDPLDETQFYYQYIYKFVFSPDGKRVAMLRKFNIDLFDFDRCTGALVFVQNWKLIDSSLEPSLEQINRGAYGSVIFSEDGEKLILKNEHTYMIIDLNSDNILPIIPSGMYITQNILNRLQDGSIFTYSSLDPFFNFFPVAGIISDSYLPGNSIRYNFTMFDNYYFNSPFIGYGRLPILPTYRQDPLDEYNDIDCKTYWYIRELEPPIQFNYNGKTYHSLLRKFK